jgi:hypothetical protein
VKKLRKLAIKKVTLRDLDEPALDGVAGATGPNTCPCTVKGLTCAGTCAGDNTCPVKICNTKFCTATC